MRLFRWLRMSLMLAAVSAFDRICWGRELNPLTVGGLICISGLAASSASLAVVMGAHGIGQSLDVISYPAERQDTGHDGDLPGLGNAVTGVSRADTAIVTASVAPCTEELQLQLQDCWLVSGQRKDPISPLCRLLFTAGDG